MSAPTITAGIHTMTSEAYHADPAPEPSLSNGVIKTLLQRTPRHAWMDHPRLNPFFERREDEQKFDIGTASHSLLLEGIDKAERIDAKDWRTNAAKDARDAARAAGKIPLLPDQYEAVMAMTDAAKTYVESTALRGIFERAKPEQSVLWNENGIWCRARPDLLDSSTSGPPIILDYKSTGVEPSRFMRSNMLEHGYDTQAVWYPRGLAAVGLRDARFIFLVQESFAPFLCYLVEPAESMVELASNKIARAVALWRDCLHSNRWPGYSTHVHQAEAPQWAIREEEFA